MADAFWDRVVTASKAKPRPRPKTKPRAKPKAKAPSRPATTGSAQIARAVRQVGRTSSKAAPVVSSAAPRAVPRRILAQDRRNAELDAINRAAVTSASRSPVERLTGFQTSGFDPSRLVGGDGRTIGGFLRNAASGGLDIITSVPAQAQLVAEAAAYPVVAGFNAAVGNRPSPGRGGGNTSQRLGRTLEQRLESDLRAAGTGVKRDYAHRYGPLLEGDLGEFGSRFYEDPTPTILDVLGAKSIVGRTPNVARRAVRSVAPASRAGMRANRSLSTLSAAERETFAKATGQRILPGPGGRHRPPRTVTSRVARDEPGLPVVGERTIEVRRRPYSGDAFARTRQKAADKLAGSVGARIQRHAEDRQVAPTPGGARKPPLRRRVESAALRPFTGQAKFDRAQRSATREIQDLFDARAEVATARSRGAGKSAIGRLKPDRNAAGTPTSRLSQEEAAFAIHSRDILGEVTNGVRGRGGLTASQLRDAYLRRIEGEQRRARARGDRTENVAAQAQVIRALPDELLQLTDMSNPAVRRVAAAVTEARRLNANAQLRSIEAGVVKPATVAAAATRDSGIGVGGVRLGRDAMKQVLGPRGNTTRYAQRLRSLNKRLAAARAAGNRAEVRRLIEERRRVVASTRSRVRAIRRDATRETPELKGGRERLAVAQTKLDEAVGKRDVVAATRARDAVARHVKKLEDEALGFTSPRRPELVGTRGVYTPDRPVDVRQGYTGPRRAGRMSGPDQARRSEGRLKARGNIDLNPALVLYQHKRAMQNYTGRISRQALDELLATAAYIDPKTGKALTGNRLRMLSGADSQRVRLVHVGNLEKALAKLDDLADGRFLDDGTVREVFTDSIPQGAKAGDYVAISKAAADVWTEAMTSNSFLRGLDKGLNYWKGGLLALSPRWYVNNTFGLALQYGIMAGPDISSIFRANRSPLRRAMERRSPNTIKDTLADDLTGGDIPKAVAFGFRINSKLEEFWRRGAYMNRTKQALRSEGVKPRKLSDAEMVRMIESMPESMARDLVRDVDFFIGNYRKFNRFEREVLKRILPFYSWLRVIARLTFALPMRSPARAAAMSLLETASTAGINPTDRTLDYFERGALRIAGTAVPTWGLNPWQTLAPVLVASGEANPVAALSKESVGWINPLVQLFANQAFGTNNFGQGIIAPPNTAEYGQDPESFNPVTKRPSRQPLSLPIREAVLNAAFPGQISVIRRVAAGNRSAYDTVETTALVNDFFGRLGGRKRDESLYRPVNKSRGRQPSALNPYSTFFGIPIYNQDDAKLVKEANRRLREFYASQRKLRRKRERGSR